jgi:hypothetical protein
MKKIFRMALVFALAGATLMYTGCTKDYGEEIDNLDAKLTNVQKDLSDKLSDLQGQLSTVKSGVSSLESAVAALKTADEGFKTDISGLKTKVAAIEDAIKDLDKLATKKELADAQAALEQKINEDLAAAKEMVLAKAQELQDQIDAISAALELKANAEDVYTKEKVDEILSKYYTAEEVDTFLALKADADAVYTKDEVDAFLEAKANKADVYTKEEIDALFDNVYKKAEVDEKLKETLAEAKKYVDEAFAVLSNELRSIVFLPDFYFAGIESTSFDFADFTAWEILKESKDRTIQSTAETQEVVKYTLKKGAPTDADILYYKRDGKLVYFKYNMYGQLVETTEALGGKPVQIGTFTQGQIGKAQYNLNPSTFNTDDADWSLNGRNVKYIVKAEEKTWHPIFEDIKAEDGLATVYYSIENPELVFSSVIGAFPFAYLPGTITPGRPTILDPNGTVATWNKLQAALLANNVNRSTYTNVPTMQLQATFKTEDEDAETRSIYSDWHAITSFEEVVSHLAFGDKNPYTTNWEDIDEDYGEDCGIAAPVTKDLYPIADFAVLNETNLKIKYNGGPVDLAKLINVHTIDAETGKWFGSYSLEQFQAKYPGYHYEFALVPYTIGSNATSEDMYGKLEGTNFIPCYVKSEGGKASSIEIPEDSEDGISAVGRMPVVLVTLVADDTEYVHAYGWFKILISKDDKPDQFYELPDLGKVPYICNTYKLATKWHEFSYFVLEALKVDYEVFIKNYKFTDVYAYVPVVTEKGIEMKFQSVVNGTVSEGANLPISYSFFGQNYDLGTAKYAKDASGSGINDAITWNVNPRGIGAGKNFTIYYRFENGDQVIYFALTANVAEALKYKLSNKIANEWYDDIDGEAYNTGRINVKVPNATSDDVTNFFRYIDEFFRESKPGADLYDSDAIYTAIAKDNNLKGEIKPNFVFTFSDEQPVINGLKAAGCTYWKAYGNPDQVPLYTNWWDDSSILYVPEYEKKGNAWVEVMDEILLPGADLPTEVPAIFEKNIIATLSGSYSTGNILFGDKLKYQYAEGETPAKALLNLWSYKETDQAKMLYANIDVAISYGTCKIPAGSDLFHMRFVRPIDVNFQSAKIANESVVTGANVLVAKFIEGITDWNNMRVIVPAPLYGEDGKPVKDKDGNIIYTEYFEANIINKVNMFKYYGFDQLILDIANAERDNVEVGNPSKRGKVSKETPYATLEAGTVVFGEDAQGRPTETFTANNGVFDITTLDNLKGACIHYENGRAVVESFNIYIPVTVTYSWGAITGELTVKVEKTADTPGQ